MATDAITAEYLSDALDFAAELKENGREVSFGNEGAGSDPWNPSSGYVETGRAHILPSEWKQDFSADVQADDLIFFASNEVDVSACSRMVDGGRTYSVQHVKPENYDGITDIFYEVQVRA